VTLQNIHLCVDANGQYTAHHNVNDVGEEEEDDDNMPNNDSFEIVLPESINGNSINFSMSEKAKVCVSFENCKFPIEKVRSFIYQSPVKGWQVTFVEEHTRMHSRCVRILCKDGSTIHSGCLQ
jgi:hypothetical protein